MDSPRKRVGWGERSDAHPNRQKSLMCLRAVLAPFDACVILRVGMVGIAALTPPYDSWMFALAFRCIETNASADAVSAAPFSPSPCAQRGGKLGGGRRVAVIDQQAAFVGRVLTRHSRSDELRDATTRSGQAYSVQTSTRFKSQNEIELSHPPISHFV